MRGILEKLLLIVLIWLPMRLARQHPARLVRTMVIAVSVAWFLLVFIAPRLPE
jgi:hypothetical protein